MDTGTSAKNSILVDFAAACLQKMQIEAHTQQISRLDLNACDRGLRTELMGDRLGQEAPKTWPELPPDWAARPRILLLQDLFGVAYILLPCEDGTAAIFGPFLMRAKPVAQIQQMVRRLKIPPAFLPYLEQYFASLPALADPDGFAAFIQTLGEQLFEAAEPEDLQFPAAELPHFPPFRTDNSRADLAGQFVQRYREEDKGLAAVAKGDYATAEKYLLPRGRMQVEMRQNDPVRNYKNYIISLSALLRKAVQKGNIHPLYIDDLSRQVAIQIEKMNSLRELEAYPQQMIRKYCFLVQHFCGRRYSLTVQKITHIIQLEPEGDLSLSAVAARLGLSRTYISGLFKKETGMTFTDYVNKSRMEYAAALLHESCDSIRDIAVACGIPDQSYFSKLFKAQYGLSPQAYRRQMQV